MRIIIRPKLLNRVLAHVAVPTDEIGADQQINAFPMIFSFIISINLPKAAGSCLVLKLG